MKPSHFGRFSVRCFEIHLILRKAAQVFIFLFNRDEKDVELWI